MDFTRVLSEATILLLQGLRVTVIIAVLSLLIGMVLGFVMCLFGMSRIWILRWISKI